MAARKPKWTEFKALKPRSLDFWLKATVPIAEKLHSLTAAEIAEAFRHDDESLVEYDADSKGNTRSIIRHVTMMLRMNMLFAREERLKLEQRVATLEASTLNLADAYQGSWMSGKSYARGQVVNYDGSLWLALCGTERKPGTTDSGWRLVVKAGRDANKDKT